MQLRTFLEESGTSVSKFAREIDVLAKSVYRYMDGTRRASPAIMYRIVTATNGAVEANDFYAPPSVNQFTPGA